VIINEDIEVSIPVEIAPDQVPEWKSRRLEASKSRHVDKDRIWQISAGNRGWIQFFGAASRKYARGCRAFKGGEFQMEAGTSSVKWLTDITARRQRGHEEGPSRLMTHQNEFAWLFSADLFLSEEL
jgi:hypothetical protein